MDRRDLKIYKTGLKGYHLKHTYTYPQKQGRALQNSIMGEDIIKKNQLLLKSLYTNTQNTWNKKEELDVCVQLQGYHLAGTTETL